METAKVLALILASLLIIGSDAENQSLKGPESDAVASEPIFYVPDSPSSVVSRQLDVADVGHEIAKLPAVEAVTDFAKEQKANAANLLRGAANYTSTATESTTQYETTKIVAAVKTTTPKPTSSSSDDDDDETDDGRRVLHGHRAGGPVPYHGPPVSQVVPPGTVQYNPPQYVEPAPQYIKPAPQHIKPLGTGEYIKPVVVSVPVDSGSVYATHYIKGPNGAYYQVAETGPRVEDHCKEEGPKPEEKCTEKPKEKSTETPAEEKSTQEEKTTLKTKAPSTTTTESPEETTAGDRTESSEDTAEGDRTTSSADQEEAEESSSEADRTTEQGSTTEENSTGQDATTQGGAGGSTTKEGTTKESTTKEGTSEEGTNCPPNEQPRVAASQIAIAHIPGFAPEALPIAVLEGAPLYNPPHVSPPRYVQHPRPASYKSGHVLPPSIPAHYKPVASKKY